MGTHTSKAQVPALRVVHRPLLLMSDIDDTMVGHELDYDKHTAAFSAFWQMHQHPLDCRLAYNTGRSLEQFHRIWREKGHLMPVPDHLVCGVGTRIYSRRAGAEGWVEDAAWTRSLDGNGWDVAVLLEVIAELTACVGASCLCMHEADENSEHKQTFSVAHGVADAVLESLKQKLADRGMAYRYVFNHGREGGKYHVIDVLPEAAGKGNAALYLRQSLGLDPSALVVVGDGANDIDMLKASTQSIVVSNAGRQLRQWAVGALAEQQQQQHAHTDTHATNGFNPHTSQPPDPTQHAGSTPGGAAPVGQRIVMATQPAAAGILQGLQMLGMVAAHPSA
ncbi:MAG: hypothetical protein WDW38_006754 [Sanguina aurantia]